MKTTTTIATKVTNETAAALQELAERRGTTVYDIVLNAITMVMRLGSKELRLSPEMKANWHAFEHLWGSQSVANLSHIKQQDLDIEDAIYIVHQEGKRLSMLMHMHRPFFGEANVSINTEAIVEQVLATAYPSLTRALRNVKEDQGLHSVVSAISNLIDQYEEGALEREIAEMFSDCDRHEWGMKPHDASPYVKRYKARHNEQRPELPQTDIFSEMAETGAEDEDGGEVPMPDVRSCDPAFGSASCEATGDCPLFDRDGEPVL